MTQRRRYDENFDFLSNMASLTPMCGDRFSPLPLEKLKSRLKW